MRGQATYFLFEKSGVPVRRTGRAKKNQLNDLLCKEGVAALAVAFFFGGQAVKAYAFGPRPFLFTDF